VNQPTPYKTAYRPEIDGLRAFAVLSVVGFHAFPSLLQGGFIGVDIFFVISGFLITSHIFEKLYEGQFSFTDFFGRRIRRIFPALILVMVFSLSFGWFALLSDEYAQLGKHIASGVAFITNFILVDEVGYFDNAAETKPMFHLWSLAVEEQFYVIWPIILWFAWKRHFNLLLITVIVTTISFCLNLWFVKSYPTEIFFWTVVRLWEILSGSILAWLFLYKADLFNKAKIWVEKYLLRIIQLKDVSTDGSTISNIMCIFGFLLLAYGVININEALAYPSQWTLIPIIGSLLIIASGSKGWLNRMFLMNPTVIWFGLISYPLYLWHWPILSFFQIIEGEMPNGNSRVIALLLSILLAWLTYRFVEKPLRFGPNQTLKSIILIFTIILVGLVGLYVYKIKGVTTYNQPYKFIAEAKKDWGYPKGLVGDYLQLKTSRNKTSVLLFGDSTIEAFGPRISYLYEKGLIKEVGFVTYGGCLPIPKTFLTEKFIEPCSRLFNNFEKVLIENPIKTIILGGFFGNIYKNKNYFYVEEDGSHISLTTEKARKKSIDYFYTFIEQLSKTYEVVVMYQPPSSKKFSPENMISKSGKGRSIPLSIEIKDTKFSIDNKHEKEMEKLLEPLGVKFISQIEKICPNNECSPLTVTGKPKFMDNHHMRPFFVISKMNILDEYILKSN
jgi:peptidoglycan/LPS O-acetylase OafA/YrhL